MRLIGAPLLSAASGGACGAAARRHTVLKGHQDEYKSAKTSSQNEATPDCDEIEISESPVNGAIRYECWDPNARQERPGLLRTDDTAAHGAENRAEQVPRWQKSAK